MISKQPVGIEFGLDSNVHIEVVGPNKDIRQTIDVHNKATKRLVSGIMHFIRGEMHPSTRREDVLQISNTFKSQDFIPCYINIGTGGIRLVGNERDGYLPDYNPTNRRFAPLEPDWDVDTNYVRFSDTKLAKEQTSNDKPRVAIGHIELETDAIEVNGTGDIMQTVFSTTIPPGEFSTIYSTKATDIFITEIGLFPSAVPGTEDLLARVIFKNNGEDPNNTGAPILYVRPQDTIIINWIISIISLNDYNKVDEDSTYTDIDLEQETIPAGTLIDDSIPYTGTIEPENEGD